MGESSPNDPPAPATAGAGTTTSTEADLLFALVRARYGTRLTPEQLDAVRHGVTTIVEETRALRAVPLRNSDAPLLPSPPDA